MTTKKWPIKKKLFALGIALAAAAILCPFIGALIPSMPVMQVAYALLGLGAGISVGAVVFFYRENEGKGKEEQK